jgi:hypothetical protein
MQNEAILIPPPVANNAIHTALVGSAINARPTMNIMNPSKTHNKKIEYTIFSPTVRPRA